MDPLAVCRRVCRIEGSAEPDFELRDLTRSLKYCILPAMKAMDVHVDEAELLSSLRQRDQLAFTQLVEQYHVSLVRLARLFFQAETVAEELSQETWIAVLQGLDGFEGRSSLK